MGESNLLEQLYKWKDIVVGIDYGQGGDKAVKVIALYHPNRNFEVLSIEVIGAFTNKQKLVDALSYNDFVGQNNLHVKVTNEDKIIAEIQEILIID